jgi:glycogen debranching enzyme
LIDNQFVEQAFRPSKVSSYQVWHWHWLIDQCFGVLIKSYQLNLIHFARFSSDVSKDSFCDISITTPGAYEYYVEFDPIDPANSDLKATPQKSSRSGYFVVEPRLWVHSQPRVVDAGQTTESRNDSKATKVLLPLDGLVIESAVGKWLGKISQWDTHLQSMKDAGYNMIHFVPLQVRGASNSPYSIHDQTAFSDDLFDEKDVKLSREEKSELVKRQLRRIQEKYGIMCLSDVVWNHTSFDSIWLQDHPESGMWLDRYILWCNNGLRSFLF